MASSSNFPIEPIAPTAQRNIVIGIDHETNKMLTRLRYILEEQNSSGLRISVSEVVRRAIKEMAARYNTQ